MTNTTLNNALAAVVMHELKNQPEKCIVVSGKVGGAPCIRHRDGEWEYATVTAGQVMRGTKSATAVRGLLRTGPHLALRDVTDVDVWDE